MVVIRQNHIGDGPRTTAFVITGLLKDTDTEPVENWLEAIVKWYQLGYKHQDTVDLITLDLQNKKTNSVYYTMWKHIVCLGTNDCQAIYDRLSIDLSGKDIIGESFYYGFPLLTLGDYVEITALFGIKCTMTFPCSGDLWTLSQITGVPFGTYIANPNIAIEENDKKKEYGDENTLFNGTPIYVGGIVYRPDLMVCDDGYYRYYDRENNECFDIDENGPLNDKWFMKYGRCKW